MRTSARVLLALVVVGSLLVWAGVTPAAAHDHQLIDGDEGSGNSVEDGNLVDGDEGSGNSAEDGDLVDGDEGSGNSAEDKII